MGERIEIKLFATLGRVFSVPDSIDLSSPWLIQDLIREIGIPDGKVTIIFVNSRHADKTDTVHPGETLSLFPPVGGG